MTTLQVLVRCPTTSHLKLLKSECCARALSQSRFSIRTSFACWVLGGAWLEMQQLVPNTDRRPAHLYVTLDEGPAGAAPCRYLAIDATVFPR